MLRIFSCDGHVHIAFYTNCSKNSELKITLLLVNIIVNTECQHSQNSAVGLYQQIDIYIYQCDQRLLKGLRDVFFFHFNSNLKKKKKHFESEKWKPLSDTAFCAVLWRLTWDCTFFAKTQGLYGLFCSYPGLYRVRAESFIRSDQITN